MSYIQPTGPRFDYFNRYLPEGWYNKKILDYGGNSGNLIRDSKNLIIPSNYTCLDVSPSAIELGKKDFPDASWIFYNRHHPEFNPNGDKDEFIPDIGTFDIIIACSVFTHSTLDDMIKDIEHLRKISKQLAFTIMVPENAYFYANKRKQNKEEIMAKIPDDSDFVYLINDTEVVLEEVKITQAEFFMYFCSKKYLKSIFPDIEIYDYANGEIQHCCLLKGYLS